MNFIMKKMNLFKRGLLAVAITLLAVNSVFAQDSEEDENWFWNKPISEISFEGLKNVKKSELNSFTDLFLGRTFNEDNYAEMIDRLYAMDLFDDIEPYAKHAKKQGEVLLVLKVTERPVVSVVTFAGNQEIRNGELRDKITVKVSDVFVESKVLMDERILREYYIQKGFINARVGHRIEETADGVKVIYVVTEGSHVVITGINIQGCTIASEKTLKSKLSLKEAGFLRDGAFQRSSLEADKQTILAFYNERGYMDVSFVDVLTETKENTEKHRNEMTITFIIQEGSQYVYTGCEFIGNEVFSSERLASFIKLKEGAVFNNTKFTEALMAMTNLYYENGYMTLEFVPMPVKDSDKHEISYKIGINEKSRSHIEHIIIKGNNKTKEHVIRREIPIEEGDVFSRDKIMNGYRNLYNLQFFSSVMPEYEMGSEPNLVDLIFNVEEQSTTTFSFGLTFSGAGLAESSKNISIPFSLNGKLENSNLFGEGRSISTSTTLAPSEQAIDFTYGQNWVGDLPLSFSQSLSFAHSSATTPRLDIGPDGSIDDSYHYMNYEGWSVSLGSALGKRWTPNFAIVSWTAGINTSLTNYMFDANNYVPVNSGIGLYGNRWGWSNSFWTSASLDGRDIAYDPSKGWFLSERLSWFGFIPKIEKEFFLKSDLKAEGYLTLLNLNISEKYKFKLVLADQFNFANIFPVSPFFSDSNKVYIDGMFNARGWNDIYNIQKGKSLLTNNIELRFPVVPGYLGGDFFFDTAVVKTSPTEMFTALQADDFFFSFGVGARFLIPQFPLHLIFAWKFKPEDGKLKWAGDLNNYNGNTFQFVLSFNLTNR